MKLTAVIEKTSEGFMGYLKEIDHLITAAQNIGQIKSSFQEVLNDHILSLQASGKDVSRWKKAKINFVIDIEQFFGYYKMINKSAFARYIGINPILFRQYTKSLVPISDQRVKKITEGLHSLAKELEEVTLARYSITTSQRAPLK